MYISLWLTALLLIAMVMLVVFQRQFTYEELQGLLIMKENPAHIALQGPFFAVEHFQAGHFYAVEMHLFTLIAVAIFNIFLVMQNTRGEEEKGRYEVLRSLPIDRLSAFHATMAVVVIANVILAISHGVALSLLSIDGITTAGAFMYGASLGVTGIFFGALSALLAQFSHSTKAVTGYAFAVLIASYLLRAVGDVSSEALARVSPLGLPMRVEAFVGNRVWPLLVMLGVSAVLYFVACIFNARRDMGQGLLPERQGNAHASAFLKTPVGFAWRQNSGTFFSWAVGLFGFGAAMGGILRDAEHFAGEDGAFQMFLPVGDGFSTIELFTMFLNVGFAIICIAPVLVLVFKVLREEKEGRAEPILSGAISRSSYLAGFVILAFLASLVMPILTAMGMWAVSSIMLETPLALGGMLYHMIIYVPALWILFGLAVFVVGVWPRGAVLCWVYFCYIFIVGFFGDLLSLPQWATNLTPVSHIPQLPLESIQVLPLLILAGIAVVLTVCGFVFYSRRDVG